jgi:F-box protein 9
MMNEDAVRLEKAIDLYEQGASKENTGLMRDAIILYRAALKVGIILLL